MKKKHELIRNIDKIPGIGVINSVKIVARVVDGRRFRHRNNWLNYCGLVKNKRQSGGRVYGKKTPRHCGQMKDVFKVAASTTIHGESEFAKFYTYLIQEKNYTDFNARHAVARRAATLTLGVIKSGEKFQPYKWRKECTGKNLKKTTP